MPEIVNSILHKENWNKIDLLMSYEGFKKAESKFKQFHKTPNIYVHLCVEGPLKNTILRIGKAESGAYTRWIKATDSHMNTYLYSVGLGEKYTKKRAYNTPAYMLFFAGLQGLNTEVFILNCADKNTAQTSEYALINFYQPLWEVYKYAHKLNPVFPILMGEGKSKKYSEIFSEPGVAINYINAMRLRKNQKKELPDIIDFKIVQTHKFILNDK